MNAPAAPGRDRRRPGHRGDCGRRALQSEARPVVSAIDARRPLGLMDESQVPAPLLAEVRQDSLQPAQRFRNSRVDAVIGESAGQRSPTEWRRPSCSPPTPAPDIAGAFSSLGLGQLPERPPVMIAFPATWNPAGPGRPGRGLAFNLRALDPAQGEGTRLSRRRPPELTWKTAEKARLGDDRGREETDRRSSGSSGTATRAPIPITSK